MIREFSFLRAVGFSFLLLVSACGDDATGPGPPRLSLERSSISILVTQFTQIDEQILISNVGESQLEISDAEIDLSWLSVSQESLSVGAGSTASLTITANPGGAAPGSHTGKLSFSSNDPDYPMVLVTVAVNVEAGAFEPMTVFPELISLTLRQDEIATRVLTLSNPGAETRSILGVSSDCDWAFVEPTEMILEPGQTSTATLTIFSSGLVAGRHFCDVRFFTDDTWVPILLVSIDLGIDESVGAHRIVVAEEFTGTWCLYCPSAMQGLHNLKTAVGDNLVIVAYHITDEFSVPGNNERAAYYGVQSAPDVYFDGIVRHVGGSDDGIPVDYSLDYAERVALSAFMTIDLFVDNYDSSSGVGRVSAALTNLEEIPVDVTFRLMLTGIDTLYNWQNFDHLYNTVLHHVAGTDGMPFTIDSGNTETASYMFTVPFGWRSRACELVALAQDETFREIIQGASTAVP